MTTAPPPELRGWHLVITLIGLFAGLNFMVAIAQVVMLAVAFLVLGLLGFHISITGPT